MAGKNITMVRLRLAHRCSLFWVGRRRMRWNTANARVYSQEELADLGIATAPSPPLRFDRRGPAQPRPLAHVIARAQALYALAAIVECAPRERIVHSLETRGLTGWLSARERRFVRSRVDEQELIVMSWRVERLAALGWALGLVPELPLTGADAAPASAFAPIDPLGTRGRIAPWVELRTAAEITDRLDAFHCAHRALADAHAHPDLDPDAIRERRHGLEWLFTEPGADWEVIDLHG
jgi:hypothetical protein